MDGDPGDPEEALPVADHVPVDTLYYATVVTRDAKAIARNHAEFYGIDKWKVVHHEPPRITNLTAYGRKPEFSFISATGKSPNGGVEFQIVQPTGGLSTFEEFLITRGQGIHSIFTTIVDDSSFDDLKAYLATLGIRVGQSFTVDDAADYVYFDTREALGGYFLQVVVPRRSDWQEAIRADEEWDFSGQVERPKGVEAVQQVTGITHFGVVVRDVLKKCEMYARVYGQPVWHGRHWRTEAGWLTDTTYHRQPVVHGWLNGRANVGTTPLGVGWGFEIVQPAYGLQTYKEDFLDVVGPGIQHVDLVIPFNDMSEWEIFNRWLDDIGIPNVMTGTHSRLYHYQDGFKKLGYVMEVHPPFRGAMQMPPSFTYDFTEMLAAR